MKEENKNNHSLLNETAWRPMPDCRSPFWGQNAMDSEGRNVIQRFRSMKQIGFTGFIFVKVLIPEVRF